MSNTKFFNDAIAEAKTIRETALANAKLALEEAFTPQIQSMLEKKLSEESEDLAEDKDLDETKVEESAIEEKKEDMDEAKKDDMDEAKKEDMDEAKKDDMDEAKDKEMDEAKKEDMDEVKADVDEAKKEDMDETVEVSEEMKDKDMDEDMYEEGAIEEIDLDELLAELEAAEEGYGKDKMKDEVAVEEAPVSEEEVAEEAAADDEVGEISVDDLKDIIKDVMADVLGGGDGEDMEIDVDGDGDIDVAIDGDDDGDVEVEDELAEKKHDDKMDETKAELNEAINVIKTLKSELNEVNLLNAKLLYVNKLFRNKNLTEAQKVKVINSFDKAESVKEVKNLFETIKDAVVTTKKPVNESKGFASKAAGVAPKAPIVESDNFVARMQKLAGII